MSTPDTLTQQSGTVADMVRRAFVVHYHDPNTRRLSANLDAAGALLDAGAPTGALFEVADLADGFRSRVDGPDDVAKVLALIRYTVRTDRLYPGSELAMLLDAICDVLGESRGDGELP